MKDESLHPEIKRLVKLVGKILPLVGVGEGATDSFWKERSLDCHFLAFGNEFKDWQEPRVRIQFYPNQAESVDGINHIELITSREIWTVITFMHGTFECVDRQNLSFDHHFSIRNEKDNKAHLSWLRMERVTGGNVSYGSFYPEGEGWSRGTTPAYKWTEKAPATLATPHGLRKSVFGRTIVPHVSVKERVDAIIQLGRFEEFKTELENRQPRFAAA